MKKNLLWLVSLVSMVFFLMPVQSVLASGTIESIAIDVQLLQDGSAKVTQKWETNVNDGTEFYIPMQNVNHMTIKDLAVSDETGTQYTVVSNWDTKASFNQKANKAALYYGSGYLEICWGKTNYGPKVYTISYIMENAIQSFADQDGFNIRFVNLSMNPAPKNTKITFWKENTPLNTENTQAWAFGFYGNVEFQDGKIVMQSLEFNSNNHLTAMLAFQKGIFTPNYIGSGNFEDLQNQAFQDSDYTKNNSATDNSGIDQPQFLFFVTIFSGLVAVISSAMHSSINKYRPKNLKEATQKPIAHHLELPKETGIAVNHYFHRLSNALDYKDVVSAYFLHWLHQGNLEVRERYNTSNRLMQPKKMQVIYMVKTPEFNDNNEEELWDFFFDLCDADGYLDKKKVAQGVRDDAELYNDCISNVRVKGFKQAKKLGLLTQQEKGKKLLFTEKGKQAYREYLGFYNYLNDSRVMREQVVHSVHLWDDYLILATLFGLGDQVLRVFKDLAPDYTFGQSNDTTTDNFMIYSLVNTYARTSATAYSKVQQQRSSGSGGSSSFGGGGGFSGGGVGGGSR